MKRPYQPNGNPFAKCSLDLALPTRWRLHEPMTAGRALVTGPSMGAIRGELPFPALHPTTPGMRRSSASPLLPEHG